MESIEAFTNSLRLLGGDEPHSEELTNFIIIAAKTFIRQAVDLHMIAVYTEPLADNWLSALAKQGLTVDDNLLDYTDRNRLPITAFVYFLHKFVAFGITIADLLG